MVLRRGVDKAKDANYLIHDFAVFCRLITDNGITSLYGDCECVKQKNKSNHRDSVIVFE